MKTTPAAVRLNASLDTTKRALCVEFWRAFRKQVLGYQALANAMKYPRGSRTAFN